MSIGNYSFNLQPAYVNGTLCFAVLPVATALVTFDTTPASASIKITSGKVYNQSGKSIETNVGETIIYSISASGYTTKTGSITINEKNTTIKISL